MDTATEFFGNVWSKLDLAPGRHIVKITTTSEPAGGIERIAEIKADSLTKMEIAVGE